MAPQTSGLLLHRRVYSSIRSSLRGSPLSRYVQLDEERAGGSAAAAVAAASSARGLLDAKDTQVESPCAEEALEAEAEAESAEEGLLKGRGPMRSEGSQGLKTSHSRNHSWHGFWGKRPPSGISSGAGPAQDRRASCHTSMV